MTHAIIQTGKGTLEFSAIGQGIPVLFVHGGHSNCHETLAHKGFDPDRFLLITPTRPGYGQTPLLAGNSPRDTADLFIALLDELKIEKVILVGISAGGPTAIELAAAYQERVSKLVLISAVTKKWLTADDATYRKGKMLFKPSVEKYSWALFKLFYALFPGQMANIMFRELSTVKDAIIEKDEIKELYTMLSKQRSYKGFVNDLDQETQSGAMAGISCPTLIVHSLNDNSVNIEHAHHGNKMIKNSTLYTYNNKWGHLIWIGKDSLQPLNDIMEFIHKDTPEEAEMSSGAYA